MSFADIELRKSLLEDFSPIFLRVFLVSVLLLNTFVISFVSLAIDFDYSHFLSKLGFLTIIKLDIADLKF